MRILIVDDSKAMRMIVSRVLRQAGYDASTFEEAANGVEALSAIRATEPDLILSDWNMPEMTGIELLKALRADGRATPFGFVTSESTPDMKEQAIAAGAQFVINKPFNAAAFEEVISSVVG